MTKELDFEKAKKDYNDIMYSLCLEFNTIGTTFSENTENWTIRDMVSECQYQYECHYEEGNANAEGRYPDYWEYSADDLLNKRQFDYVTRHNDGQKELHEIWLKETRALRGFIRKYKKYINDYKCDMGHCSCYD